MSQGNTSVALIRVANDFRAAQPLPPTDRSQDALGYFPISRKSVSPDSVTSLCAGLQLMINGRKGSCWKIVMDVRGKNSDGAEEMAVIEADLSWDERFTCPFNTLCNLCMAEKVWKQVV